MDRYQEVTKFVTKEKRGIELGAWYNGITPKREGFDCLILDVFDTETLKERFRSDRTIPAELFERIEDVDLVGSSTSIAELVAKRGELGQFDYIVSSHNIEHCPDPVTFFRGCERVLKRGGYLSMIVPDKRGCFDFFRPPSTLASVVSAFFDKRTRPTEAQVFEHRTMHSRRLTEHGEQIVFPLGTDPLEIVPYGAIVGELQWWNERLASGDCSYRDAHCWVFTPSSFELIMLDLNTLGLTNLQLTEVVPSDGEFFVHLKHVSATEFDKKRASLDEKRQNLLLNISDELSITAPAVQKSHQDLDAARRQMEELTAAMEESKVQFASRYEKIEYKMLTDQAELQTKIDFIEAKFKNLEAQAKGRAAGLQAEIAGLKAELDSIHASTSWRMTFALRYTIQKIKTIANRS